MPVFRLFWPQLGHGEKVSQLSYLERTVWGTYVLTADDFGVMRFSVITIQAADDKLSTESARKIEAALKKLAAVGLIRTFVHQGRTYCYQPDWQDYQKIEYPRETAQPSVPEDERRNCTEKTLSLLSVYPGARKVPGKSSAKTPEILSEHLENTSAIARARPRNANATQDNANASVVLEGGTGETRNPTRAELRRMGTLVSAPDPNVWRYGVVDVTNKTHDALRRKEAHRLKSDDPRVVDKSLDAFYCATEARWREIDAIPTGKSWEIWFAAYSAAYGAPSASTSKTAGNAEALRRFAQRETA